MTLRNNRERVPARIRSGSTGDAAGEDAQGQRESPDAICLFVSGGATQGKLTLRGGLSAGTTAQLQRHLELIETHLDGAVVDCSEVTAIETGCLELLCSACRRAHRAKRNFVFVGCTEDLFRKAACAGCGQECERRCLCRLL